MNKFGGEKATKGRDGGKQLGTPSGGGEYWGKSQWVMHQQVKVGGGRVLPEKNVIKKKKKRRKQLKGLKREKNKQGLNIAEKCGLESRLNDTNI